MSKLTKMFGFLDKNKKQDDNLDDLGFVLPDEQDQPISPSDNQIPQTLHSQNNSNKIQTFDNSKKKEEEVNEKKNQEKKSGNNLFSDLFKKPEEHKNEGHVHKKIGLFDK